MKESYKSKVDLLFVVILFTCGLYLIYDLYNTHISLGTNKMIANAITYLIVYLLGLSIFFYTRYDITPDQKLVVKCGFIPYGSYDIKCITSIYDTHTLWGAPAVSLDRINIVFSNGKSLVISPKKKEQFINALRTINPQIKYVNRH